MTQSNLQINIVNAPVACALSPSDFQTRRRDLAALASRALRSRTPIAGGERLTFAGDNDTTQQLELLVAAESECCPFLLLQLDRDGELLVLDVTGPDDAQFVIRRLFA